MEMIHPGGYFPAMQPAPSGEAHADGSASEAMATAAAARLRMNWDAVAEALGALISSPDAGVRSAAVAELAGVHLLRGDLDVAQRAAEGALAGDAAPRERGRATLDLGIIRALRGDVDAGLEHLARADVWLAEAGDDHGRVLAGASRAWALVGRAQLRDAWNAAADALRRARRIKDDHATSVGLMATALVDHARGSRGEARQRLGEAVRGFARAGDVLRQVQCHHLLGEIAYEGEDPIRAGALYREALSLARPAGAQEAIDRLTLLFEHR
jgi:tetratricopeptide (TPR) repeat protein